MRTYDVFFIGGHFDYIQEVATKFQLPDPTKGWETFQPPLYYIFGAISYNLFGGSMATMFGLQLTSLLLSVIFVIFGVKILSLFIKNKLQFGLATALFVFFPSGVILSTRIGNDIMITTIYTIALYCICKWWIDNQNKYLWLGSIFGLLATVSKSNGLVVCVILLLAVSTRYIFDNVSTIRDLVRLSTIKNLIKINKIPLLFTIFGFLANFSRNLINYFAGTQNDWLVSSVELIDPSLAGTNNWQTYFGFDFVAFLFGQFTDTRYDVSRNYFWNFLIKTSLFGEFKFWNFLEAEIALILNFIALFLVGIFIFTLIRQFANYKQTIKQNFEKYYIIWLNIVFLLGGLLFYRIKMPFVSNNDFRYIYPFLLSFIVILFSYQHKILNIVRNILVAIFVILSILFFFNFDAKVLGLGRNINCRLTAQQIQIAQAKSIEQKQKSFVNSLEDQNKPKIEVEKNFEFPKYCDNFSLK
jgi:4-amino-4-deoxy-L-arabinose transferase-like glycosyltransferase